MKFLLTILTIMTTTSLMAQDGKASTTKKTFSRETSIRTVINADAAIIWALLTNAADYPRWNSTIVSLEGNIQEGEKIRLKSTLDEKRTFKLKVKALVAQKKLVWGDGKGHRVFLLEAQPDGKVVFSMSEKIGGLMFPMYAKYIPPFDASFEQFARDLKQEAERVEAEK